MKIRSNDPQKTSRSTRAQSAVRSYSGANQEATDAKRRKGDKVTVSSTASKLAAAVQEAADGSTREADELRERLREQRRLALEVADGARALEEKAHEATTRADREARARN